MKWKHPCFFIKWCSGKRIMTGVHEIIKCIPRPLVDYVRFNIYVYNNIIISIWIINTKTTYWLDIINMTYSFDIFYTHRI